MKKKEKEAKEKNNLLDRYNGADAKKNFKFTAMKTGADFVIGVPVGCALGAVLGIWAPLAGLFMFGAGHYLGDKTGLLRVAGASAAAYGIAKAVQNRSSVRAATVEGISLGSLAGGAKQRLIEFKDDVVQAFFVDKLIGSKTEESLEGIGQADLSELDVFENLNREAAINHELKKIRAEEQNPFGEVVIHSPESEIIEGLNYAVNEEVFDLNTI